MRLIKILLIFVLPLEVVIAQNTMTFLNDALSFQRPKSVTLWEERPYITELNYTNFWLGRIQLVVYIYDEEALKNEPPTIMNKEVYDLAYNNEYLPRDGLLNLFTGKSEFVLFPYIPQVVVRNSYKLLQSDGRIIGESFFHANAQNLEAKGNFGYTTSVIIENKIVNIYLSVFTGKDNNPIKQLEGYSVIRDDVLFWINNEAQNSFYEYLSSERYIEMPLILQQLREAYDIIIQTLKVRQNESGKQTNIDVIKPSVNHFSNIENHDEIKQIEGKKEVIDENVTTSINTNYIDLPSNVEDITVNKFKSIEIQILILFISLLLLFIIVIIVIKKRKRN